MAFGHKIKGFSLIELMVVISIISTLTSIGAAGHRKFVYKAIQAEAQRNVKYVALLASTFESANDRSFDPTSAADCGAGGHRWNDGGAYYGCQLFNGDVTNCNTPNALGYKMTDCLKIRYEMHLVNQNTAPRHWFIQAWMKPSVFAGNARGDDAYFYNSCNAICHGRGLTSLSPMTGADLWASECAQYSVWGSFAACR